MTLIDSNPKLKIGENAPDFTLKGVDREMHSLKELRGVNASLIIFMCNHCPYVKAKLETIKILNSKYSEKGLAVIGINPNESDPLKSALGEYVKRGKSFNIKLPLSGLDTISNVKESPFGSLASKIISIVSSSSTVTV